MQAVSSSLGPHVGIQGCYFHLTQSTWRKIQELGLVNVYRVSDDVKQFWGMLDRVIDGMTFLILIDSIVSVSCIKVNGSVKGD